MKNIPYGKQYIDKYDKKFVLDSLQNNFITTGPYVKKLEDNKWVYYSKKEGVKFCPSEENNKFLADIFNHKEVRDLGRFLDVIEKQKI